MKMQNSVRRGFTLIELLVVVAIIVTLISILLPSLSSARTAAKRSGCAANQRSIAQANIIYSSENNGWSAAPYLYNNSYMLQYIWFQNNRSGIGLLLNQGQMSNSLKAAYCPLTTVNTYDLWAKSYLVTNKDCASSYCINRSQRLTSQTITQALTIDYYLFGGYPSIGSSYFNHKVGLVNEFNVSYTDGSVNLVTDRFNMMTNPIHGTPGTQYQTTVNAVRLAWDEVISPSWGNNVFIRP